MFYSLSSLNIIVINYLLLFRAISKFVAICVCYITIIHVKYLSIYICDLYTPRRSRRARPFNQSLLLIAENEHLIDAIYLKKMKKIPFLNEFWVLLSSTN